MKTRYASAYTVNCGWRGKGRAITPLRLGQIKQSKRIFFGVGLVSVGATPSTVSPRSRRTGETRPHEGSKPDWLQTAPVGGAEPVGRPTDVPPAGPGVVLWR